MKPGPKHVERPLQNLGIELYLVHEERIPEGKYWLGREYALISIGGRYRVEFRSMKHREIGPAVWDETGYECWYYYDKIHRIEGRAYKNYEEEQGWCIFGMPHRIGAPAIEKADGEKKWYFHGRLHREDGPAIERVTGPNEFYIDGIQLTEVQYDDWKERYKDNPFRII